MFYRKFFAHLLLVLYGVPAVIGPHWHSHRDCGGVDSCCEVATGAHASEKAIDGATHCQESLSQSIGSAKEHHCNCHHQPDADQDHTADSVSQVCAAHDTDCSNCSICHFYACTPFAGLAVCSSDPRNLVEAIAVADYQQLRTIEQLHFARGPPASLSAI